MTLLDALRAVDAEVPHLCHDDRIAPIGACRMCLVELAGHPRPVAACTTPLADGMQVVTRSPELDALRDTNRSLLAKGYPSAAAEAGLYCDETHPLLGIDMTRCINCYRCVRICEEVQGADIWQVWGRGPTTRVAARGGATLLEAGCVSCGACADTCPTDAIFDRRTTVVERWTRTTCVYCGVGCQLEAGTADGRVVAARPVNAAVNRGHLCVKGRYAYDFNDAPDRITTPMLRRDGAWHAVTWEVALDEVASRLAQIRRRHGADAIGMLGSARATNEENYYAQKFARVVLGTHNVDCCARVCHQPSAAALKDMLGAGAATNSFDDIEQAATILIAGCNPTENHPIVGARIRQAVRRGARLIVIDPRRTELAEIADVHLPVRPGTNIPLLNAMAATLLEEQLVDRQFLANRVDGLAAFAASLADFAPESVAALCGVNASDIRTAARLYATGKPSMCFHGLGITEHLQGTDGVFALINLALLTGNLGRAGAGINPLRGQNNVQGSAHMGCEPQTLTGGQLLADARARFEAAWGVPLPTTPGLNLLQMMDAADTGRLKAIWACGYDLYATLANAQSTASALGRLDLVVIQDLFMNRTAEAFGHVFLPAASVFEKDGTFMNSDRRVQRVRAALPPAGESRTDSWIIAEVAARLGYRAQFAHASAQDIWDEVRSVWPQGAGLSYDRLETDAPPHWPCPDETHPGTPVLHAERFVHAIRATLQPMPYIPSPEIIDADFPLRLTTGRHLYQFNTGTMTQRSAAAALRRADELEMAPADAAALGIADGESVAIESRHGRAELPVRVHERIRPGELFTTFHFPPAFVNQVTSPVRDRRVGAPEYKLTAVRVVRLR